MRKYEGAEEEKQEQEQEEDWLKAQQKVVSRTSALSPKRASRAANVAFQCTPEKLHALLQVVDLAHADELGQRWQNGG